MSRLPATTQNECESTKAKKESAGRFRDNCTLKCNVVKDSAISAGTSSVSKCKSKYRAFSIPKRRI